MNDFVASLVSAWGELGPATQGGLSAAGGWFFGRAVGWLILPRTEREATPAPSRAWVALAGLLWLLLLVPRVAWGWLAACWIAAPPPPAPVPAPLSPDAAALVEEIATNPLAAIMPKGGGKDKRLKVGTLSVDVGVSAATWHIWEGDDFVTADYTSQEAEVIHAAAQARAASIEDDARKARRAARVKGPQWIPAQMVEPKGTASSPNPRKAGAA